VNVKINSPMATGNGAYVIHNILAREIIDYRICAYNPYWTLLPPTLPFLCRKNVSAELIHTTPDYGWFFKKKGIPLVITFHNYVLDSFMDSYSSLLQRIHYKTDLRYFIQQALKTAHTVTSVSKFTAELVRQHAGFTGRIEVIYNGIDTMSFRPEHPTLQREKSECCSVAT